MSENKLKKPRKAKKKVNELLVKLMVESDSIENEEPNEKAEKVTKYEGAVSIVEENSGRMQKTDKDSKK